VETPALPQILRSSQQLTITTVFTSPFRGRFQDRIELVFEDQSLNQRFVIIRLVKAISGDRADHELLQPRAPYVPRQRTLRDPEIEVIPGIKAPSLGVIPWVIPLPEAPIPHGISNAVATGTTKEIVSRLEKSFLPNVLTSETYGRHFKTLLWVEEYRTEYVHCVISREQNLTLSRQGEICRYTM
jgi:helicase MOV-10